MNLLECITACFGIIAGCMIIICFLSVVRDFTIESNVLEKESEERAKIAGYKQATKQKKLELKLARKSRPYQLKD